MILAHSVRITPSFREILERYLTICRSESKAFRTMNELSIYHSRRSALHNEAAALVRQRLTRKGIQMHIETARHIVRVITYGYFQNQFIR
jgi:uncharacterized protein (UPF0262 family)